MTTLVHLADEFLIGFMLVLAVVPLGLAMFDGRRREAEQRRLRALRREARVAARLRDRRGDAASGEVPLALPHAR
jgi:hypothetical protein